MTNTETGGDRSRSVFVVHGRNKKAQAAMFAFLRSIGLKPIEWSQAIAMTGEATPYPGRILDVALDTAQAVVVLFTPDEFVALRPEYADGDNDPETATAVQARPNVLFEAGMAMGRSAERTVLVQLGEHRSFSDASGRHMVRLTNSPERRKALTERLRTAGCEVDTSGDDWFKEGDFSPPEPPAASSSTSWTLTPLTQTEHTVGDEELFTFMDAWAQPVFGAAKILLDLAMNALRGQDDLAKRDLAVLYQRVYDDADRTYSLAFNASEGLEGSPSPQAAVGTFIGTTRAW